MCFLTIYYLSIFYVHVHACVELLPISPEAARVQRMGNLKKVSRGETQREKESLLPPPDHIPNHSLPLQQLPTSCIFNLIAPHSHPLTTFSRVIAPLNLPSRTTSERLLDVLGHELCLHHRIHTAGRHRQVDSTHRGLHGVHL